MHLKYNISSGPFLTVNFQFDLDHGQRPGPELANSYLIAPHLLSFLFGYKDNKTSILLFVVETFEVKASNGRIEIQLIIFIQGVPVNLPFSFPILLILNLKNKI